MQINETKDVLSQDVFFPIQTVAWNGCKSYEEIEKKVITDQCRF